MTEQKGYQNFSRLGKRFINAAALAAESSLEPPPGRDLLSTIGAATKRHHMGLDRIRQNPLADFLGVEDCSPQSQNIYDTQHAVANEHTGQGNSKLCKTNVKSTKLVQPDPSIMMSSVPQLNLLATAALARDSYRSSKMSFKSESKPSDIINEHASLNTPDFQDDFDYHMPGDSLMVEDIVCVGCNTAGEEATMLFCAICQDSYHILCIDDRVCDVPEGWSALDWNELTDWNKSDSDPNDHKTYFNSKREWICRPCTTISNSFDGNNLNILKSKLEAHPPGKRKGITRRRNKGEAMLWSSSYPGALGATATQTMVEQNSWTCVENTVVTDVSNIEVLVFSEEDKLSVHDMEEPPKIQREDLKYIANERPNTTDNNNLEMSMQDSESKQIQLKEGNTNNVCSKNITRKSDIQTPTNILNNVALAEDSSDADSFVTAAGSGLIERDIKREASSSYYTLVSDSNGYCNDKIESNVNASNEQHIEPSEQHTNNGQKNLSGQPKTDDQNSLASSERFGKQGSNNNEMASLVRSTKLSRKCIVNLEHTNCSLAVNVLSKDQNLNSPLQKSYLLEEINENELRNKCAIDATGETQ